MIRLNARYPESKNESKKAVKNSGKSKPAKYKEALASARASVESADCLQH